MAPPVSWNLDTSMGFSLRLHKSALVAALSMIERAPCFRREPGFFLGSLNSNLEQDIALDRFDSGRLGEPTLLMPRDVTVKVKTSLFVAFI